MKHLIVEGEVSSRIKKCLLKYGYIYFEDLSSDGISQSELFRIPNFGKKSLKELMDYLSLIGLNCLDDNCHKINKIAYSRFLALTNRKKFSLLNNEQINKLLDSYVGREEK